MELKIYINGRRVFAGPYRLCQAESIAAELSRVWNALEAMGRFAIVVHDGAVAWIIGQGGA